MAQGLLFAPPMPVERFARAVLGRPIIMKPAGGTEDRIAG